MHKWIVLDEEPIYEISQFGTIRNVKTKVPKAFFPGGKGQYLRMIIDSRWWKRGGADHGKRAGGGQRQYIVHRLVAKYFVPNPSNYPHVNHLDGNKYNNHYSNLEWCTIEMNNAHAKALGLMSGKALRDE